MSCSQWRSYKEMTQSELDLFLDPRNKNIELILEELITNGE